MQDKLSAGTRGTLTEAPDSGLSAADFSVVTTVIQELAAADTLSAVTAAVTTAVRSLLGADGVTFVLRDGDQCYYADESAITPLWKGRRFPLADCISGWCMAHQLPAVIEDIRVDARIPQEAYRQTFVRSLAMVPVGTETPVAAVGAYWQQPHQATARQLTILQMMADVSALAIARQNLRTSRDEARAAAEHQRKLVSEIAHRVKNTLAVVQALAYQSTRKPTSFGQFRETFLNRIGALGTAHTLLAQHEWKTVPLHDLVTAILAPLRHTGCAVAVEGENLRLSPKQHLTMSLVLNELASNATRHGALASPGGAVRVSWEAPPQPSTPDEDGILLIWEERGPSVPAARIEPCVGLTLVDRLLQYDLNGDCTFRHEPDALVWRLRFPCGTAQ